MSFDYTRSQFKNDINAGIKQKIGMIANSDDFVNRVVREVKNDIAIRSARRKVSLTPDLFEGIYQYACPTDIHANRIIDIPAQAKRHDGSFGLVPTEQFNVNPRKGDIAFDDYNGIRVLLINSEVTSEQQSIDPLDVVGDWTAFGDAENLEADSTDYIKGSGSLEFDIDAAGGTTAGIENSSITSFDISDFLHGHSAVFVWAKITSTTNLTNYILRLGTDSSNYYSKTITTRHDGTAFATGWNLLRFDISSLTETGSVTNTDIKYAAAYMTKTSGKVSETDYKFDWLIIKKGVIHNVLYYSRYGWQSSAGTYMQNSTDESDLLVADDTEYEIFLKKGIKIGLELTNSERSEIMDAEQDYQNAKAEYGPQNPDESMVMVSEYQVQ